MIAPKLFVSYCWSSPDHEQWVIDLAIQLRESGIDVILDKWDLKEGNDAVAFMEKMVTDPSVLKVLMISDKAYAEKADGRAGGVGTETQIISREVYEHQEQKKFVAVLPCRDELGKPYLPTYYKSRIYIDLSEPDRYTENFEQLLRWVFDKPRHIKPAIGNVPGFLTEGARTSLGTTTLFNRCIDAIKNNRPYAAGALDEYFTTCADNFERFRLRKSTGKEFDDIVVENIEEMTPSRNEILQLLATIAQYAPTPELAQKIHRFFERLIAYMDRPPSVSSWQESDFDNFKFIVHEIFLHAVANCIKHERFALVNELLTQQFYLAQNSAYGDQVMNSFVTINRDVKSLDRRNQRLGLRRQSLQADMLKKRAEVSGVDFGILMQADFILFIRSDREDEYRSWWPVTLVYAGRAHGAFEVFRRSVSKTYFDRVKCLLGIEKAEDLKEQLEALKSGRRGSSSFNPSVLIGFGELATKP